MNKKEEKLKSGGKDQKILKNTGAFRKRNFKKKATDTTILALILGVQAPRSNDNQTQIT